MKKVFYTLFASAFILGCNPSDKNTEKNLMLIEKYIQAVENLDYETMAVCLDENYIGMGPSYGDSIRKPQALENWKYSAEILYKSIKYTRSRNIAVTITTGDNQGDWVSNWAELNITYQGDEGSVTVQANSIYQIEKDKILKSFTFYNEADVLEQLGYVFINLN